jgi:hypothetical protein
MNENNIVKDSENLSKKIKNKNKVFKDKIYNFMD